MQFVSRATASTDRFTIDVGSRAIAAWIAGASAVVLVSSSLLLVLDVIRGVRLVAIVIGVAVLADGIARLVGSQREGWPLAPTLVGAAWTAMGVACLMWPGLSLAGLVLLTGFSLIIGGIAQWTIAFREAESWRLVGPVLAGMFDVLVGAVCLVWPRATLAVLTIMIGLRLFVAGCRAAAATWGLAHTTP
jgi:uncharacterized membrane protein HdeD (DUF308 family)